MTQTDPLPNGAAVARRILTLMRERIEGAEAELARLDGAIGDGDHGAGMVRGLRAACAAADADALPETEQAAGAILVAAGAAFADAAGGASGALVGTGLLTAGQTLGSDPCSSTALARALAAALATLCALGEAGPGDKTMVDTLHPFVQALGEAAAQGQAPAPAWQAALPAAQAGAAATAAMVSRRGRSSRLGERSRGHLDAGAVSMLYMLQAAGSALQAAAPND